MTRSFQFQLAGWPGTGLVVQVALEGVATWAGVEQIFVLCCFVPVSPEQGTVAAELWCVLR